MQILEKWEYTRLIQKLGVTIKLLYGTHKFRNKDFLDEKISYTNSSYNFKCCAKQVVGEYTYAPCGSILNQTYISDSLDLYMTTFGDTDINLSRKGYPGLKLKKQIFLFNNSDKKNGFDINIFQFTSLEEYEKRFLTEI